jgi:hypothetical protein
MTIDIVEKPARILEQNAKAGRSLEKFKNAMRIIALGELTVQNAPPINVNTCEAQASDQTG